MLLLLLLFVFVTILFKILQIVTHPKLSLRIMRNRVHVVVVVIVVTHAQQFHDAFDALAVVFAVDKHGVFFVHYRC